MGTRLELPCAVDPQPASEEVEVARRAEKRGRREDHRLRGSRNGATGKSADTSRGTCAGPRLCPCVRTHRTRGRRSGASEASETGRRNPGGCALARRTARGNPQGPRACLGEQWMRSWRRTRCWINLASAKRRDLPASPAAGDGHSRKIKGAEEARRRLGQPDDEVRGK